MREIHATLDPETARTFYIIMTTFQMSDAGTYTLVAENKNGTDKVPMDLIVLDPMNDCDCDMFKNADLECHCSSGFRHESNCLKIPLGSKL